MRKYKAIFFDLDGTLADSAPGILECHQFTAKAMGLPPRTPEQLDGIIGGALDDIYTIHFGMSPEDAAKAVTIYRDHYAAVGIDMARLYDGVNDLLQSLHNAGAFIAIATLKREDFAISMMKDMGILHLFHTICGVDTADTLKKHDLVNKCIKQSGLAAEQVVLVGDSKSDAQGAQRAGIGFIGVTYGYGFKTSADVNSWPNAHGCASDIEELKKLLLNGDCPAKI